MVMADAPLVPEEYCPKNCADRGPDSVMNSRLLPVYEAAPDKPGNKGIIGARGGSVKDFK